MEIAQINEDWITSQLNSDSRYKLEKEFKFILAKGPDKKGYVRFDERHMNHDNIYIMFRGEIIRAGKSLDDIDSQGGGFVIIPDFEKILEEYGNKFDKDNSKKFTLKFYGNSLYLGRFNHELLEKTLSEGLSKRFLYKIE